MDFIDPLRLKEGSVIGEGSFGKVLEGELLTKEGEWKKVAIKLLPEQAAAAAAAAVRPGTLTPSEAFMEEITRTIMASRKAPHVVHCWGWSAPRAGQLALVMKLYKCTLHRLLDDQVGDLLPVEQVLRLGLDIALGLRELHEQRIVFEDLKPGNILVDDDDRAVLADFGLSRPLGSVSHVSTQTVAGTYFFMAPEKIQAGPAERSRISYSADVWAYGITLLQILQSNLAAPYGPGTSPLNIVMQLVVQKEVPEVPATPEAPALQQLLQSCLSLDPKSRPTAAHIVKTLEGMLQASQTGGRPQAASSVHAVGNGVLEVQQELSGLRVQDAARKEAEERESRRLAEQLQKEEEQALLQEQRRQAQELQEQRRRQQQQQQQQAQREGVLLAERQKLREQEEREQRDWARQREREQGQQQQQQREQLRLQQEREQWHRQWQHEQQQQGQGGKGMHAEHNTRRLSDLRDLKVALDAARMQRDPSPRLLIFDLGGRELQSSWLDRLPFSPALVLTLPSHTCIRNGSLKLPDDAKVLVPSGASGIQLASLRIRGGTDTDYALLVQGSASLRDCHVEGGGLGGVSFSNTYHAAVGVLGRGASMTASNTSMRSKESGLYVGGGRVELKDGCSSGSSGVFGWAVSGEESKLVARDSCAKENESHNALVELGATADLQRCVLTHNGRKHGCGLWVRNEGSQATCSGCTISGAKYDNVFAFDHGQVTLSCCECNGSKEYGLHAGVCASISTDRGCTADFNKMGSVLEEDGGKVVCHL